MFSYHDTLEWNSNLDYRNLEVVILKILKDFNKDLTAINFIFCSDDYLLDINRKYLNHDYFTDVITFDYDNLAVFSDVYISIERVRENALDLGVEFEFELKRVAFHAVLHLCGLKDVTVQEKQVMRSKEDYYLNLFVSRET